MTTIARTPDSTKLMRVIEVRCVRGEGTGDDVARIVTQYWSVEGKLLAEDDPESGWRNIVPRPINNMTLKEVLEN